VAQISEADPPTVALAATGDGSSRAYRLRL